MIRLCPRRRALNLAGIAFFVAVLAAAVAGAGALQRAPQGATWRGKLAMAALAVIALVSALLLMAIARDAWRAPRACEDVPAPPGLGAPPEVPAGARTVRVHDNGNRPFLVVCGGKGTGGAAVYEMPPAAREVREAAEDRGLKPEDPARLYTKLVKKYAAPDERVLVATGEQYGSKPPIPSSVGHTVLVRLANDTVAFVGARVLEFKAPGFVHFESYIGPNDVPYSRILARDFVYFIEDGTRARIADLAKAMGEPVTQESLYKTTIVMYEQGVKTEKIPGFKIIRKRI